MESPIELVRRFCAAWSANAEVAELAGFFTDDAVYHNIPLAPVSGKQAIVRARAFGARADRRSAHRSPEPLPV
jgi:limonene-1,2-epoxide hydrolase